jgi:septal ring factor EnvC (AmiA/AmiB activator)
MMTSVSLSLSSRALFAAAGVALWLGMADGAWAQTASVESPVPDKIKQHDQALEAVHAEQKKSFESEKKLRAEIAAIGEDRRKFNQDLIDTAARVRSVEDGIAATEARLKPLDEQEEAIRKSLNGRRGAIAEVLAALQRIGRRPPPALLVKPEDALQSVRTAIMLGAVLPEMRNEAEGLASDLGQLVRVRKDIADERDRQRRDLEALAENHRRLSALVDERQKRQSETQKALDDEQQHAAALSKQAGDIEDLISTLEQNLDSANRAARLAERSQKDDDAHPDFSALHDPGRIGPAVAFASARGLLRLPVNGVKIRDFGSPEPAGGVEKGISLAARVNAQVTSPCDGWVVYAGPFRSYGQLLILNAGGGYHVLLAGMERISVDPGQFVLSGEPVAIMGGGSRVAATGAAAIGLTQPVLYVEFRKDGTPVDPAPWWAATEGEKVRG